MEEYKQIGLLLLVVVLVLLAQRFGKRQGQNSRSGRLMKKYARITPDVFEAIPRDELVTAMVCRVLSEAADTRHPDVVKALSTMSHGYTVVYSIWAVCSELAAGDFAALMSTPTKELVELACEAMAAVGAPRCAAALEAMRAAHAEGQTDPAAMETYRSAVTEETPLSLCEDYILDRREEFTDDPLKAE